MNQLRRLDESRHAAEQTGDREAIDRIDAEVDRILDASHPFTPEQLRERGFPEPTE